MQDTFFVSTIFKRRKTIDDLLYDNEFTSILDEMEDSLPTTSSTIASGDVTPISENMISSRFQSLSQAGRQKIIKDSIPESTQKKENWGVKIFFNWHKERQMPL